MANVQFKGTFMGAQHAGVAVTVKDAKTNTNATLTSDRNATQSLSNPVTTTTNGTLSFFAPPGRYVLTGAGQTEEITLTGDTGQTDLIKPTATGSRAAYSAAREQAVLQALSQAGLITDNTTA